MTGTTQSVTASETEQVQRANESGLQPDKKQKRNNGVTEIVEMKDRGHALTIDSGWREVAEKALNFVKRFV